MFGGEASSSLHGDNRYDPNESDDLDLNCFNMDKFSLTTGS